MSEAYSKNHMEIQRRQHLAQSNEHNPRTFERAPGAAEPAFRLDSQTHFVWSASHERMAPVAKDPRHPAVRIYGLFASYEAAAEHASVVSATDPTCSLMVSPTHEWTMVPRSPERLAGAADHIQRVLSDYDQQRETSTREFRENVAQQRGGLGRSASEPTSPKEDSSLPPAPDGTTTTTSTRPAPHHLGRDAEVRDQSLVAVTFLRDRTQSVGEPIFRVYAAFQNTDEGDAWARVAGDTVVDYDMDLVSTCAWLFLNDVASEKIAHEVYRSKELESIISNHKKQPQMCENYHKWRQESESEA